MVNYRRNRVTGGTFFFTLTLRDRRSDHLTAHIDALRDAFRVTRATRPFRTDAIVVLPEHLHAIWTLPENDADFAGRWQNIKSRFSRALTERNVGLIRNSKGELNLWQRRYWEHTIRDDTDLQRHIDYVHFNPVKHGLVRQVGQWPHSSFHQYVRDGVLAKDWGGHQGIESDEGFGE